MILLSIRDGEERPVREEKDFTYFCAFCDRRANFYVNKICACGAKHVMRVTKEEWASLAKEDIFE